MKRANELARATRRPLLEPVKRSADSPTGSAACRCAGENVFRLSRSTAIKRLTSAAMTSGDVGFVVYGIRMLPCAGQFRGSRLGREDKHWYPNRHSILAKDLTQRKAIHERQEKVGDDQRRNVVKDLRQRFPTIRRFRHVAFIPKQRFAPQLSRVVVGVYDENPLRAG